MSLDKLTGLPTHLDLSAHLGLIALPFATIFDIDGLAWITYTFGHQASDQALIRVSQEIQQLAASQNAQTFRIGGDEFMVVLIDSSHADALVFAQLVVSRIGSLQIEYQRRDNPSRRHLVANAIVSRVNFRLTERIAEARKWIVEEIYRAKGGDVHRAEVVADVGENLPPFLAA